MTRRRKGSCLAAPRCTTACAGTDRMRRPSSGQAEQIRAVHRDSPILWRSCSRPVRRSARPALRWSRRNCSATTHVAGTPCRRALMQLIRRRTGGPAEASCRGQRHNDTAERRMSRMNGTHDPALKSWVEAANAPGADFPIQNLPFAVLRRSGTSEAWRCAVAIGDQALDLRAAHQQHLLPALPRELGEAVASADLRALMGLGPNAWSTLRAALSEALRAGRGDR